MSNNHEFLASVYGGVDETQFALWVCGFEEEPTPSARWSGREYRLSNPTPFNAAHNNYTVIATLTRAHGRPWRDDEHFGELRTIVLDDIGTKVPAARIKLPATWELETSPGNFQLGYRLAEPVGDQKLAKRLVGGLIDAGLTDGGMSGVVRYFRLPEGANNKPEVRAANDGRPWPVRLRRFKPDQTYPLQDLATAFNIDVHARKRGRPKEIELLADEDDPILAALSKLNLLNGHRSHDGWYGMTCPWEVEHPNTNPSATAYHVGGGWRCQHDHCAERRIDDVLRWLEARGENVAEMLAALPKGHRALLLGVRDYVYAADVKRFIHLGSAGMIEKEALADYHAAALNGASFAQALLKREDFRKFRRTTYRPGRPPFTAEQAGGMLLPAVNLWRPGPVSVGAQPDPEAIGPWLDHLAWLFPAEDERALVLDFLTHLVQRRGEKINWALVLVAQHQGTGRDTLMAPIVAILGETNVKIITGASLSSDFNGYVQAELVYLSELEAAQEILRKIYAKLKEQIVAPPNVIEINEKNIPQRQIPKVANHVIVSNSRLPLTLEHSDRRFAIFETRRTEDEIRARRDVGSYRELHRLYAQPRWLENFHAWLMARPISETFDARGNAPDTAAKRDLIANSETPEKGLLRDWIEHRVPPFDGDLIRLADAAEALRTEGNIENVTERFVGLWLMDLGAANLGECRLQHEGALLRLRLWAIRDQERHLSMPKTMVARAFVEQQKRLGRPTICEPKF